MSVNRVMKASEVNPAPKVHSTFFEDSIRSLPEMACPILFPHANTPAANGVAHSPWGGAGALTCPEAVFSKLNSNGSHFSSAGRTQFAGLKRKWYTTVITVCWWGWVLRGCVFCRKRMGIIPSKFEPVTLLCFDSWKNFNDGQKVRGCS